MPAHRASSDAAGGLLPSNAVSMAARAGSAMRAATDAMFGSTAVVRSPVLVRLTNSSGGMSPLLSQRDVAPRATSIGGPRPRRQRDEQVALGGARSAVQRGGMPRPAASRGRTAPQRAALRGRHSGSAPAD